MTKASVVIPNLNGMAYLENCLGSLRAQKEKDFDVILIDNGSTDGSADYVKEHFPEVRLITFASNTGFCRAVNEGIRLSSAPYVILLNNDTVCGSDFVGQLIASISRHKDAFSCGAKMLSMKDKRIVDDAGDFYCALGWAYSDGKGKAAERYTRERRVFSACAGAAIYRRDLLISLGLFDEAHFAYLEDVDVGYRARIAGYFNYYAPKALVLHAGSASSGSTYNEFKIWHTARNSLYLVYKNMPPAQIVLNLPFLAAGFFIKWLFFVKRGQGRVYRRGLKAALAMDKKGARVPFRAENFNNYVRIQLELWANVVRRIGSI